MLQLQFAWQGDLDQRVAAADQVGAIGKRPDFELL